MIECDLEGYAIGLDPFTQADLIKRQFDKNGFVVISDVVTQEELRVVRNRVMELLALYQHQVDSCGVPIISRGFFEIYHDCSLAMVRQSQGFYKAHTIIWDRIDLWVTFDRFVVKNPNTVGLPLHLDQNPNLQPGFDCTQGLVSICNNLSSCGSILLVAGSHKNFEQSKQFCNDTENYCPVPPNSELYFELNNSSYNINLRDGDGLIWDSRVIHGSSDNISEQTRIAALVSYQPQTDNYSRLKRVIAFANCEAYNDRNARMHASIRPRFNDSLFMQTIQRDFQITTLGKLLYGIMEY